MNLHQRLSRDAFCLFLLLCMVNFSLLAAQKGFMRVSPEERAGFLSEEKVAIVVGVSIYPSHGGLSLLEYADDDAVAMGKQLEAMGYKVRVLTNAQATRGAVLNVVNEMGQFLDPEQGTFLFYFSGHGFAHDKVNYFATYESDPNDITQSGLALNTIVERMQTTGARRQVLLVDACRNDPGTPGKALQADRSFIDFGVAEGSQILFSTKFGGKSYEYSALHHGVYTHYLLKGLKGAARRADGLLSFGDLATYVSTEVKAFAYKANRTQVPFVAGESYGDFLLHADKATFEATEQTPEPESSELQQAALDLSLPDLGGSTPPVTSVTPKKKRPWYKNPWLWVGVFAGGAGAAYMSQSESSEPTGDRSVVTR